LRDYKFNIGQGLLSLECDTRVLWCSCNWTNPWFQFCTSVCIFGRGTR